MNTNHSSPGASFWVTVAAFVAMLVATGLYVASSGPSIYLMGQGYVRPDTYISFYKPLSIVEPYLPDCAADSVRLCQ